MIVYLKSISEPILNIGSIWTEVNLDNINIFQKYLLIQYIKNYSIICSSDGITENYDLRSDIINYLI